MIKKISWILCVVALAIAGCTKEEAASPKSDKLHPVKFNVSTFGKQIVPMAGLNKDIVANASSNNALPYVIQSLTYVVFDESGKEVSKKVSTRLDENFGMIEDELPAGSYKATFSGSDMQGVNISNFYGGAMSLHTEGKGDIFYKEADLIVEDGAGITTSVELVRKVGKIEVDLLDEIPSKVSRIDLTIFNVSSFFNLKDHSGRNDYDLRSSVYYRNDPKTGALPDYSQPIFSNFFLDKDLPFIAIVIIQAYDQVGKQIADKVILNVPVAINKKTILTGELFDDTAKGQEFSVSFVDDWNSDIINIHF